MRLVAVSKVPSRILLMEEEEGKSFSQERSAAPSCFNLIRMREVKQASKRTIDGDGRVSR